MIFEVKMNNLILLIKISWVSLIFALLFPLIFKEVSFYKNLVDLVLPTLLMIALLATEQAIEMSKYIDKQKNEIDQLRNNIKQLEHDKRNSRQ